MNKLQEIIDYKKDIVSMNRNQYPLSSLENKAKVASPVRGFTKALGEKDTTRQTGLIAEIKKASPSKGLIRADFDPKSIAVSYEDGGATCLSVLTDEKYFQGNNDYLQQARDAVSLPVLRKDFMIDPYQIIESRALDADCILLIMACLSNTQAKELYDIAISYNMDVLIEVHNQEELERALLLEPKMVGINNRNLKTFDIDLKTSEELISLFPDSILPVCESGIHVPEDISRMNKHGFHCFLVGESLMRQDNVTKATRTLLDTKQELL